MIKLRRGNLIEADAEALVNTVNCAGYMGKGIALQFKKAFPENFQAYQRACKSGLLRPGRLFVFESSSMINPRYIINFPTKDDWREKSRLQNIEAGLSALVEEIRQRDIRSVAIPPLGCGLGGLQWRDVRPLIERAMSMLPEVEVLLYEPAGTPSARKMPVGTRRPRMTRARALFIRLMSQYAELDYRMTLLEIQKLAYFLQEAGEPLRLRYEEGLYGPYAHNLNKMLELLEGHFTQGYGDAQRPDEEVELLPGSVEVADNFLADDADSQARLHRISELIEGFETPYGMELLSSVHWTATHVAHPATDAEEAISAIHAWNNRKRSMFDQDHVRVAWQRLVQHGWVSQREYAGVDVTPA